MNFRAIGEAKRNPKVVFILRSLMTAFASCSVIARLDRAIPLTLLSLGCYCALRTRRKP